MTMSHASVADGLFLSRKMTAKLKRRSMTKIVVMIAVGEFS